MEPNGSLTCSKTPTLFPHIEPGRLISDFDILFIQIYFKYYPTRFAQANQTECLRNVPKSKFRFTQLN